MKECIECGRPLFDQNTPDESDLCDECYAETDPKASDLFY